MSVTMGQKDVPLMQPAPWMTDPSWFLVSGLPWPDDHAVAGTAGAAFAIAPPVTQVVRRSAPMANLSRWGAISPSCWTQAHGASPRSASE